MNQTNLRICRYIAGLCFAVNFVFQVVWYGFDFSSSFMAVLYVSGYISIALMAVSMFTGIFQLMAVGAIIEAIYYLICIIRNHSEFYLIVYYILSIACYMLIASSIFQREHAVKLTLCASISLLLAKIVNYIPTIASWGFMKSLSLVYNELTGYIGEIGLPIILSGFVLNYASQQHPAKAIAGDIQQVSFENRIENLTKLKELLDIGAISQEEFDVKKKQFLDL